MNNTDETTPQNHDAASAPTSGEGGSGDPRADDRRGTVNPAENPVPSSPEPDEAAVREGEEKLGRVKPY